VSLLLSGCWVAVPNEEKTSVESSNPTLTGEVEKLLNNYEAGRGDRLSYNLCVREARSERPAKQYSNNAAFSI